MERETLDSKLQQLFRSMEDLDRSNNMWRNLILSWEPDPVNDDDEQLILTHLDDTALTIQLLESEATNLASSFPGTDGPRIKAKLDGLREGHAAICGLYARRNQWVGFLSLIGEEDNWFAERVHLLVDDWNCDPESIEVYQEQGKVLSQLGAELAVHKKVLIGIRVKISTFPATIATESVLEHVGVMSLRLVQLRKLVARKTKDMIEDLKCLQFFLKAFHIRLMVLDKERTDIEQESAPDPDLDSLRNQLMEQGQFNLELKALIEDLATLQQMRNDIVGERNIYSAPIIETFARLAGQLAGLVFQSGYKIGFPSVNENSPEVEELQEKITAKFGVLADFLGGLQEHMSIAGKKKPQPLGCAIEKLEELVQSGETHLKSLEALIDELEARNKLPAPRYHRLFDKLEDVLSDKNYILDLMRTYKGCISELTDGVGEITDLINESRSDIQNSRNKQEQRHDVEKLLAEMNSLELTVEFKMFRKLDANRGKLMQIHELLAELDSDQLELNATADELVEITDEHGQMRIILKELIQSLDQLKELASGIKEKLEEDHEPNFAHPDTGTEELSDAQGPVSSVSGSEGEAIAVGKIRPQALSRSPPPRPPRRRNGMRMTTPNDDQFHEEEEEDESDRDNASGESNAANGN